jgi:hypothetical protein
MSIASLIFSLRVQSQLADANLGAEGLNALFGVLACHTSTFVILKPDF